MLIVAVFGFFVFVFLHASDRFGGERGSGRSASTLPGCVERRTPSDCPNSSRSASSSGKWTGYPRVIHDGGEGGQSTPWVDWESGSLLSLDDIR